MVMIRARGVRPQITELPSNITELLLFLSNVKFSVDLTVPTELVSNVVIEEEYDVFERNSESI